MTRLLVSVRSAAEAVAAIEGGADIIDVKEPLRGALGAADAKILRAVREEVEAVGAALPLSAALGELLHGRHEGESADGGVVRCAVPSGYRYAKFGLAGSASRSDWHEIWRRAICELPQGVEPVAVAYADWRRAGAPAPQRVLETAANLRCAGLLVDTFDKSAGDLFHWLSLDDLAALAAAAREAGMFVAVGGSLTLDTAPHGIAAQADVIAVRGAACGGERTARIDVNRVRDLAALVKRHDCVLPRLREQNA